MQSIGTNIQGISRFHCTEHQTIGHHGSIQVRIASGWTRPLLVVLFSPTLASLEEIQSLVIGVVRDLRGLCSSFVSKQAYSSLFDWLYPAYLPLFLKALYIFYDRSDVYNPLLKFFHELSLNRQERLVFDSTKPSAYLLFRETSNLLCIFQSKTIAHVNSTVPETDGNLFYKAKLKPIITALRIIRACLIGMFWRVSPDLISGVLRREFRQLRCLSTLLGSLFRELSSSISLHHLLGETNASAVLSETDHRLLRTDRNALLGPNRLLGQSHSASLRLRSRDDQRRLSFPGNSDSNLVLQLPGYISLLRLSLGEEEKRSRQSHGQRQWLRQLIPTDSDQSTQRDHLRRVQVRSPRNSHPRGILSCLRNIYAVSKPLLGLILLNENQFFTEIKQQLLFGHTQAKQAVLSTALDKLMTGIDRTLTQVNKEHFTQNITQFRNDIQDSLRGMMINNNTELSSTVSAMPLSSSFLSSASSIATNVPVTIAISTLIPSSSSSSSTVAVEELMTLWSMKMGDSRSFVTSLLFINLFFYKLTWYLQKRRETRAPYLSISFFTFFLTLLLLFEDVHGSACSDQLLLLFPILDGQLPTALAAALRLLQPSDGENETILVLDDEIVEQTQLLSFLVVSME